MNRKSFLGQGPQALLVKAGFLRLDLAHGHRHAQLVAGAAMDHAAQGRDIEKIASARQRHVVRPWLTGIGRVEV